MSGNFTFKQFEIIQDRSSMKVNTDGILLGAWVDVDKAKRILDIGTGNGLIALMVAQRNPESLVTGVEIDEGSYQDATENAANSPFTDRVDVVLQDIQSFSKTTDIRYDLIVSNPPFFSGGTFSTNENKANVRHTVKLPHGDLLNAVVRLLKSDGYFAVILPIIEGLRFIELAERSNLHLKKKCTVFTKNKKNPERLLLYFSFEKSRNRIEEAELFIHDKGSTGYSDQYKSLTFDFYLDSDRD